MNILMGPLALIIVIGYFIISILGTIDAFKKSFWVGLLALFVPYFGFVIGICNIVFDVDLLGVNTK